MNGLLGAANPSLLPGARLADQRVYLTMLISQVFPSKYLTSADLGGKSFTLTIRTVTLEEMQTHDHQMVKKPVVWFTKAQRGFVLNVTNARIIAALYGDDTDAWAGQRITIYATKVRAFGTWQDAIRVREEVPAMPKPVAQAHQVEESSELDHPEDVADYDPNLFDPSSDAA